jgi:hypothetical protein
MTASRTCSNTWFKTRVEFRVWTRDKSSCCCSTHGNSAIWAVECSVPSWENFKVTLPSWTCEPGWSSAFCTLAAFT